MYTEHIKTFAIHAASTATSVLLAGIALENTQHRNFGLLASVILATGINYFSPNRMIGIPAIKLNPKIITHQIRNGLIENAAIAFYFPDFNSWSRILFTTTTGFLAGFDAILYRLAADHRRT